MDPTWLIEPFPGSVARLRERFGKRSRRAGPRRGGRNGGRVRGTASGSGLSRPQPRRLPHPAARGLRPRPVWEAPWRCGMRSLDSLRAAGEIPGTGRAAQDRCGGRGRRHPARRGEHQGGIVMVEFWAISPTRSAPAHSSSRNLRALVEPLGPRRFLFVRHGPGTSASGAGTRPIRQGRVGQPRASSTTRWSRRPRRPCRTGSRAPHRSERITAEQERAAVERLELVEQLTEAADGAWS